MQGVVQGVVDGQLSPLVLASWCLIVHFREGVVQWVAKGVVCHSIGVAHGTA